MKRYIILTLVIAVAMAALIGCTPKAPPAPAKVHNDGTYFASSDATARGYMAAEVTIADDKITAVKLFGAGNLGTEKPEDYAWDAYHEAKVELPKRYVEANSWDVDAYTGATSSSKQSNQAVQRAMEMAKAESASTAKYFDGTFMAISEQDARGAWTVVLVTLENDKITDVVINQTRNVTTTNEAGQEVTRTVFKDEDYNWAEYHEAIVELPKRFIAANSAEVDAFTGATATSNQAKEAVAKALASAER